MFLFFPPEEEWKRLQILYIGNRNLITNFSTLTTLMELPVVAAPAI
jgi:hypothetical protein